MADGDLCETTIQLRRAIAGDGQSLGWVVSRLSPVLVAQARWRLGAALQQHVDPEDLVQDAWLAALPRLAELRVGDRRATPVLLRFLATAILNRTNNLRKKHLRRETTPASTPPTGFAAAATGVVAAAVRDELRRTVHAALDALEPIDREVLFLRGIEQHDNAVVADLLGIDRDAASMRYTRALRRLRERLPDSVFGDLED